MAKHAVIPDVQARPGVPDKHMAWVGEYLADKSPDTIIVIGDFWDMPSLSSYDVGKKCYEGRTYRADIEAGLASMEKFLAPIERLNRAKKKRGVARYKPRKIFLHGNHEYRINRAIENDRKLDGTISLADLQLKKFGFVEHSFLEVVKIDGIEYSHYFTSGVLGRPVTSAAALLRTRQCSATMGHVQWTDMAIHPKTQQRALFCGTCYLHDEDYLGPQGNDCRRQIIMKHEVKDGRYNIMEISLDFLGKKYK